MSFWICQIINPTMTFVPYQPFDLDIILKVTGDEKNFKIVKQGHKSTVMAFCNLFPVDIV